MPPKGHAILSASSSERWLNCPPSARLCEAYEDKGSDHAAEGTDAHTLCEYRLKQALGIPAEDPIENLSWYNEEMEDCAAGYADYVTELLETAKQAQSPTLRPMTTKIFWLKEVIEHGTDYDSLHPASQPVSVAGGLLDRPLGH